MKRKNATRNALFTSMLSLLLCVSMLVGTTFAWFTDTVESGVNTIAAGNLDVELYHDKENKFEDLDKAKVDGNTLLFTDVNGAVIENWEPGVVAFTNLKVANVGTLALKYSLSVNSTEMNYYVDDEGHQHTLSEALKVAVVESGVSGTREQVIAEGNKAGWGKLASFVKAGILKGETTSETYGIVIYWEPSENDNLFNMNNGKKTNDGNPLQITLGVNLFATQEMYEKDSFDDTYDKDSAVATIAEAEAMMAENKPVVLAGCNEPDGVLNIPADYTETLTMVNSTIKSVQAEKDANIVILGNVIVNAKGSGVATMDLTESKEVFDGSAITANGTLTINGTGTLTAIAADVKEAFGIGGMNVSELNISNVHIEDVKGSFVQPLFVNDTKYGKSEPEGGAAIGSGYNGAVITLNNVTIDNAQGGSKAAGIGARYWTGVTINITDSTIKNVEGGNASAGIGGSRVSDGANESATTINIMNSTIIAKGGQAGAGIGSGYDTHCQAGQPICTINIDGSTINATGGKYAAGIGTGYHNAGLAGEIKNSTVTAASGEKFYKDTYTQAQDIGFGVVDPIREGLQTDSKLIYNGTEITIPEVIVIGEWETLDVVDTDTTISNKVADDYVEICHKSGNLTISNVTFKNGLTIYNEAGTTGTVTLENCTINLSNGTPANTSYNMCKADYGMYVGAISKNVTWVFKNCTFTAIDGHTYAGNSGYNVYIAPNYNAESFSFEGCTFEKSAKHGIGCSSDANATYYVLTVTGCNFKDWNNNATNGAAIRGNLPATDFVANITISGNTFGNSNDSTQKTVAIDSWTGTWN